MLKKCAKCLWGIINTALLAIYLFLLYELLLVPAILDWSAFGVILAAVLIVLLIWCIPAEKRVSTTVLGTSFLLAMKALDNIRNYSLFKHIFGILFIFLILLFVGRLLGRFTFRRYLAVFLMALILNAALDLTEVRFWTEFLVKWESPLLYKKLATVDYFPTVLADIDGDNTKEIITLENRAEAEQEEQQIISDGPKYSILEPERSRYAVYKWDGRTFIKLSPDRYSLARLRAVLPTDYLGFPYYTTLLQTKDREIEQEIAPIFDRSQLVDQAVRFGSFPFAVLAMDLKSLASRLDTAANPARGTALAEGDLFRGPPTEKITINDELKVWSGDRAAVILTSNQVPDIGTAEVLTGDVDNDQTDELLLTAERSRILEVTGDNGWRTLWACPEKPNDKVRFAGFRFEDFASLGQDKTPHLIALSKSNVRNNPTRYMTGYIYKDGTLVQNWRVFSGLINLKAGDVDGDGQNELVGYMYRQQRIYVLEKHGFPVVPVLYILTAGIILSGFIRQWRRRNAKLSGGEQNA